MICWLEYYFILATLTELPKPDNFILFVFGFRYKWLRQIPPWKILLLRKFYRIVTNWQNIYWTYFSKSIFLLLRICCKLSCFSSIIKYIFSWSSYICLISIKFSLPFIFDWLNNSDRIESFERFLVLNIFFNVKCYDVSKSIILTREKVEHT